MRPLRSVVAMSVPFRPCLVFLSYGRLSPRARDETAGGRMLSYGRNAVSGHVGLRLRRVEGAVLPALAETAGDAPVLREPVPLSRDQLHVAAASVRDDARGVAPGDPGWVPVRAEGAPAHHALAETGGRRRVCVYVPRTSENARPTARPHPLPVSAEPAVRPLAHRIVPRLSAADVPIRLRISPPVVGRGQGGDRVPRCGLVRGGDGRAAGRRGRRSSRAVRVPATEKVGVLG